MNKKVQIMHYTNFSASNGSTVAVVVVIILTILLGVAILLCYKYRQKIKLRERITNVRTYFITCSVLNNINILSTVFILAHKD